MYAYNYLTYDFGPSTHDPAWKKKKKHHVKHLIQFGVTSILTYRLTRLHLSQKCTHRSKEHSGIRSPPSKTEIYRKEKSFISFLWISRLFSLQSWSFQLSVSHSGFSHLTLSYLYFIRAALMLCKMEWVALTLHHKSTNRNIYFPSQLKRRPGSHDCYASLIHTTWWSKVWVHEQLSTVLQGNKSLM